MPAALMVRWSLGNGASTRGPARFRPVWSTRNVIAIASAGQPRGSTFVTEGGAAEAIDSETHSYSPLKMTSLAASYIVRRRLLEDQTQHAWELALRGQLRSGDLAEVPGGNVYVRVAVYRVIEEIERFSPSVPCRSRTPLLLIGAGARALVSK